MSVLYNEYEQDDFEALNQREADDYPNEGSEYPDFPVEDYDHDDFMEDQHLDGMYEE